MWTEDLFGIKKPIIALLHLRALPGDPMFGRDGELRSVVQIARKEMQTLQNGGIDGILFANEFSLPYEQKVTHVTTSAMARIIGELLGEIRVPYGVNVCLNPMASLELAAATGASFIRSTFTGAYIGESGITNTDVAAVVRRKYELGADKVKLLYKVNPESDIYIAERPIEKIVKSVIFHCSPDALCVSGANAGSETDTSMIDRVKAVAGDVPVLCNTGCTAENITRMLENSDGACVGTALKRNGRFSEYVDADRIEAFMDTVRRYRKSC